jgi:hypothetical protein
MSLERHAGFDTILVGPSQQSLTEALNRAVKAANSRCRAALVQWSPQESAAFWRTVAAQPEGWRQWLGGPPGPRDRDHRSALAVAWWTDRLGRRHVRVKGARWSFSYDQGALQNILCPYAEERPPVWMIYPNFVYLAGSEAPLRVLAACPCGAAGELDALGWLGDRCAACHDRHEEGQPLAELGEHHLWAPLTVGSDVYLGSYPTVAFAPAGDLLAAGATGAGVVVCDLGSGATQRWQGGNNAIWEHHLCFLPDGTVVRTDGDSVGYFEATGARRGGFRAEPYLERVLPSPDGSILATKAAGGRTDLWDVRTAERLATIATGKEGPKPLCAVFLPDGRSLFLGHSDGTIRRWSVAARCEEAVWSVPGSEGRGIQELAISPDGRFLASLFFARENNLLVWEVPAGKVHATWTLAHRSYHPRPMRQVIAFAPDGRTLVGSERRGVLKFWDVLARGAPVSLASAPEPEIQGLAFSPDGRWLASAAERGRGQIKLWPWAALLAAARGDRPLA